MEALGGNLDPQAPEAPERARPRAVASAKHTAILCLILCAIAAAGFLSERQAASEGASNGGAAGLWTYAALIGAELALLAFVRRGVRDAGGRLVDLVAVRSFTASALAIDVVGGLGLFALCALADGLLTRWLGGGDQAAVQRLVVHGATLLPVWVVLSAVAGVAEEITFRGYLQRQFGSLTGNAWLGVTLQALLFGVVHGYQGPVLVARIAILGLVFGIVAKLRGSLVPGIVAHVALDVVGGLAGSG